MQPVKSGIRAEKRPIPSISYANSLTRSSVFGVMRSISPQDLSKLVTTRTESKDLYGLNTKVETKLFAKHSGLAME
eukprot:scaffold413879_cov14-Prasinocladus_malaysianus.AAC.1